MEIQLKKNIQQTMKQLDLYLIRQFLTILGISILGFTCIFLVVDLIENLDRFIDNNVPWKFVSKYYVYTVPWFFNIALPMAMLIATVFSVGLLVKRNEWTAMKSSGISLYRIAIPLIIIGIIIRYLSEVFNSAKINRPRFGCTSTRSGNPGPMRRECFHFPVVGSWKPMSTW